MEEISCGACPEGRREIVLGDGPVPCGIMLVGQNPGVDEDRSGIPYVGAAGKQLSQLLALGGLSRAEVYVTNVVKCKTPGNRMPTEDEVVACAACYLDAEVARVQPHVIIATGALAAQYFIPGVKISRVHGIPHRRGNVVILPVYHPAAMLHNSKLTATVESDFRRIPEALALAETEDVGVVVVDDATEARRVYA